MAATFPPAGVIVPLQSTPSASFMPKRMRSETASSPSAARANEPIDSDSDNESANRIERRIGLSPSLSDVLFADGSLTARQSFDQPVRPQQRDDDRQRRYPSPLERRPAAQRQHDSQDHCR